jgi:hypothetical protein
MAFDMLVSYQEDKDDPSPPGAISVETFGALLMEVRTAPSVVATAVRRSDDVLALPFGERKQRWGANQRAASRSCGRTARSAPRRWRTSSTRWRGSARTRCAAAAVLVLVLAR